MASRDGIPKPPLRVTPAEYKADIMVLFNSVASRYDQVGPAFFTAVGRALVERVEVAPGAAVLDVACGRGAALIPAAQHAGSNGRVVGVDISERMIAALGTQFGGLGLSNVELRLMDAEELAFAAAAFDRALCSMSLPFFPRPERALSEMYRVLKPGGRLAVSVFHRDDPWWAFIARLARPYETQMAPARWPEVKAYVRALEDPEILSAALMRTGFVDVQADYFETEAVYGNEQEWWRSLSSHGATQLLDMMPAKVRRRFKADAFDALRALKGPSGISFRVGVILCTARRA